MANQTRSRAWCFTINNPSLGDELLDSLKEDVAYLILGHEGQSEGKTPHLQGYCRFKNARTLKSVSKYMPRVHLEVVVGSPEANITYCSKEGNFEEYGTRPLSPAQKGAIGADYWANAKTAAQEGRLEDVPPRLFITHYKTF